MKKHAKCPKRAKPAPPPRYIKNLDSCSESETGGGRWEKDPEGSDSYHTQIDSTPVWLMSSTACSAPGAHAQSEMADKYNRLTLEFSRGDTSNFQSTAGTKLGLALFL